MSEAETGALSPQEERFEHWRSTVGLFLGPLVGLLVYLLPMPSLTHQAQLLAGVVSLVAVYWICEPIPLAMTALLGPSLCVLLGIAPARQVFAPFADPVITLFLGGFILAQAMTHHGLDRRIAYGLMAWRWIGNRPGRLLLALGGICAFLSMWLSNTATTAMLFPIAVGIIRARGEAVAGQGSGAKGDGRPAFATGLMLMTAYAASVGGLATPVGTPPNLIGLALIKRYCQVQIPFFHWTLFAVPLALALFLALFGLVYLLHRPEAARLEGGREYLTARRRELGPWTRGQKNALLAFLITVGLWVLPGMAAIIQGGEGGLARELTRCLPEGVAALVGALFLFFLPVDWQKREFTITWREASRIDWGTLLLFGGGLSLGGLMFDLGLAEALGRGILGFCGAVSLWGVTLAATYAAVILSEAASNTAAANMVVPVMISLAQAAGLNPLPPALGATLGASMGFMLPVSTPPNAIVYGSGLVPITKMIRAGLLFDLVGALVVWLVLWLFLPWLGLA